MTSHKEEHEALWSEVKFPAFGPIAKSLTCDVCVVGAGIAGLTTAYLLAQKGIKVIVLCDGELGDGQTGRTSAHLTQSLDTGYRTLSRVHGSDRIKVIAESHGQAINKIEEIIHNEDIPCDFSRVNAYLFKGMQGSREELEQEWSATREAGIDGTEIHDATPNLADSATPSLLFPNQAQFHPLKYLSGLVDALTTHDVRIFTHSRVVKVYGGPNAKVITQDQAIVSCAAVVMATNIPINDLISVHIKQAAYRSYAIFAEIARKDFEPCLLWDLDRPFHYVRYQAPDQEREGGLIVGGEDHKTGQNHAPELAFERLEAWARRFFPKIREVKYRWSGQIIEPADGIGFIGKNPWDYENVYVATGDAGNGLTHGTIAGMMISEQIVNGFHPWSEVYDPGRWQLRSMKEMVKENLNTFAQYGRWLSQGDVASYAAISPGEGAVVREGLNLVAIYRANDGGFYRLSAVCPHLAGIVQWNSAEKTWDCPCHGSRFDRWGTVIQGPAYCDLKTAAQWSEHKTLMTSENG